MNRPLMISSLPLTMWHLHSVERTGKGNKKKTGWKTGLPHLLFCLNYLKERKMQSNIRDLKINAISCGNNKCSRWTCVTDGAKCRRFVSLLGKEVKRAEESKHSKEGKVGECDIMKQSGNGLQEAPCFRGQPWPLANSVLFREMCGPSQGNADNRACIQNVH